MKAGGLLHDRRVARIVTPGTLIDENFIDPFSNNYILAIYTEDVSSGGIAKSSGGDHIPSAGFLSSSQIGLAWLDLSTGQFLTQLASFSSLPSLLARISPREIVLDTSLQNLRGHGILATIAEYKHILTYAEPYQYGSISEWSSMLESPISAHLVSDVTAPEVQAGNLLLRYVHETLQGTDLKLQPPSRQMDVLNIDRNTMKSLEIKKTLIDDLFTGSLLHTLRRTVTKGGARLLERWLSSYSFHVQACWTHPYAFL